MSEEQQDSIVPIFRAQTEPPESESEMTTEEAELLNQEMGPVTQDVRARILHLLEIFPYISRAMIQTGLSPAMPPALWDPVLKSLVSGDHVVVQKADITTPAGRALVKEIYHLPKFPYPPVTQAQLDQPSIIVITDE